MTPDQRAAGRWFGLCDFCARGDHDHCQSVPFCECFVELQRDGEDDDEAP